MEPKDYWQFGTSSVAIVISLWALFVAKGSAEFSQKVKATELRSSLLARAVVLSSKGERIQGFLSAIRLHAEALKDFEQYKLADGARALNLDQDVAELVKELAAVPPGAAIDAYARFDHRILNLSLKMDEVLEALKKKHDEYLTNELSK